MTGREKRNMEIIGERQKNMKVTKRDSEKKRNETRREKNKVRIC